MTALAEVGTPVTVDRQKGLIFFEDSIFSMSEFRAAHLQRRNDGDCIALVDLGPDHEIVLYQGNSEKDARSAIESFIAQLTRKSGATKRVQVIH
jgi:hypothetical protein